MGRRRRRCRRWLEKPVSVATVVYVVVPATPPWGPTEMGWPAADANGVTVEVADSRHRGELLADPGEVVGIGVQDVVDHAPQR